MQNNNNKPASSARKSRGPSRKNGKKNSDYQVVESKRSKKRAGKAKASRQEAVAAAYATGQAGRGASVSASRDQCRVVHREFIGNVTGAATFAVANSFAVNPGIAASFPWLSGIAQNWEAYRFRSLRFCYYTRTGTGVPGSVIMAFDPDASDAAPSTEQIMTTYEDVREDAPWKDICLPIRISSLNDIGPRKFVRTAGLAANQDIKLYDSGNLFVGVVDGTAVNWGKLWVEYDVDLFTPQTPPTGSVMAGMVTNNAGTGIATGNIFGSVGIITGNLISAAGAGSVSFQNLEVGAEYAIAYAMTTTGGSTPGVWTTPVGCTIKTQAALAGGASGTVNWFLTITATATQASLVPVFTLVGTPSQMYFAIAQVPVSAL